MTNYGFTIDSKYFKFKIENPSSETGKGFIDAMKAFDYVDFSEDEESVGTLEQHTNKALGYIRWINLCNTLSNFGIFFLEVDVLEGATALTEPTSIEFTIGYEQPSAMYIKTSDGTEYKGIDALKYLVAYVMSNKYQSFAQVYDPTKKDFGEKPSTLPNGIFDKFLTADKLCDTIEDAYEFITITEVDGPDGNETVSM